MSEFKFIRCERPDDIFIVQRDFMEGIAYPLELGCKHNHLIIVAEDINELRFEDKETIRKMLDQPTEKNHG